jgi:integrase
LSKLAPDLSLLMNENSRFSISQEGPGMTIGLAVSDEVGALAPLVVSARTYAAQAKAEATRRTYRASWGRFLAWCDESGLSALPANPGTVALYLSHLADRGKRLATIQKALASLVEAQRAAGFPSPREDARVREVMKGIRRSLGVAPRQKDPISPSDLRAMVRSRPQTLQGLRDRALLLLGFAGAFRRSELVHLDVGDLTWGEDGLTVTLRRSKTDQEGQGRKIGIPFGSTPEWCPVRTLRRWLEAVGLEDGPLFRPVKGSTVSAARLSNQAVARLVKRATEAVGLDPSRFSGHSLRAGLATAAAKAGKSERSIMAQTGHRSAQVARRYIRDGGLFTDNAAAGLL